MPDLTQKVIDLISDSFVIDKNTINLTSTISDDLNIDSLDCVELIIAIEDKFNIDISDEDANKFKTVNDIVNYLKDKI